MAAIELELHVPETEDFPSLFTMKYLAFKEKGLSDKDDKVYEYYQQKYPHKLQHCRVVRDPETGIVIGACQVQLTGDPPDKALPSILRHHLLPGEAYVEFIACHPDHTGKGIGSKLLAWAETCARENGAKFLSLEVMKKNSGAVRLYERKGFVAKRDPRMNDECDEFCTGLLVFCCFGCTYWTVLYMEKPLPEDMNS
jgi:ribosomal protein S18 acetylase RimI-like enzyme